MYVLNVLVCECYTIALTPDMLLMNIKLTGNLCDVVLKQ